MSKRLKVAFSEEGYEGELLDDSVQVFIKFRDYRLLIEINYGDSITYKVNKFMVPDECWCGIDRIIRVDIITSIENYFDEHHIPYDKSDYNDLVSCDYNNSEDF